MSTINRERAELKSFITGFLSDPAHDNQSSRSLAAEVFRIAQASLEAEPVAYVDPFAFNNFSVYRAGDTDNNRMGREWMWANPDAGLIPVYTAHPAPVSVPDDVMAAMQKVARIRLDLNDFDGDKRGILDCLGDAEEALIEVVNRRAAMLQGAEPITTAYKLPANTPCKEAPEHIWLQTAGVWPENGEFSELTWCSDNQHEDDTLYVRADVVSGSSPVIPDGWVACSERMPDVGVKVLCFPVNDEPIHATYNGQLWLQDISWSASYEPIDNVISCNVFHWMPLPAAPDFREISNSSTNNFRENAETSTKCWCHACRPVTISDMRFVVCPDCGNKRCPHANDHRNACTGSNEPGQEGSAYPAAPQQEA